MPRLTAALAALVALMIFPGIAPAQEEGPRPSRAQEADSLHTVERGESLWWMARQYYDDPFEWRRIFEANQGEISDPHWIYPGQHFVIPGHTARVTGVDVGPGGERPAAEAEEERVRGTYPGEGDRTVFSRPPREDIPTPDERTAFYPRPQEEERRGGVLGGEGVEYMAVPRDVFYSAEWIRPQAEGMSFPGRISEWAGTGPQAEERRTILPLDRVRISWDGEGLPEQGDLLQSLQVTRTEQGLGHVVRPTGIFRVIQRMEGGVVAVSVNEYATVRMGDFVVAAPGFPLELGQYAESVDGGTGARITGFAQPRRIQQPGDVAFLDVGSEDGVAVGDEFAAYVNQGGGWSGTLAGTLQVIRVFDDRASARIRRVVEPVFHAGVEVRMAGKMP